MVEAPELETPENIRLIISICDSANELEMKLEKLVLYVNKYFPIGGNNQQETRIRRIA